MVGDRRAGDLVRQDAGAAGLGGERSGCDSDDEEPVDQRDACFFRASLQV